VAAAWLWVAIKQQEVNTGRATAWNVEGIPQYEREEP